MHSLDDLYAMARLENDISLASYHSKDLKSVEAACARRDGIMNLIFQHPENKHSRRAISCQIISGMSGHETEGKDGESVPPHGAMFKCFRVQIKIPRGYERFECIKFNEALDNLYSRIRTMASFPEGSIHRIDIAGDTEYETVVLKVGNNVA